MRLTHEARKIQSMTEMPNSKEYPVRRAPLSGQDAARRPQAPLRRSFFIFRLAHGT